MRVTVVGEIGIRRKNLPMRTFADLSWHWQKTSWLEDLTFETIIIYFIYYVSYNFE
jgi:hypothetical protein